MSSFKHQANRLSGCTLSPPCKWYGFHSPISMLVLPAVVHPIIVGDHQLTKFFRNLWILGGSTSLVMGSTMVDQVNTILVVSKS